MCRSTAHGGRRCNGRALTKPATPTPAPTPTSSTPGAPAAQTTQTAWKPGDPVGMVPETTSRVGPLSDASRRTLWLRQQGWNGWVDQDGNPLTDANAGEVTR